MYRMMAALLSAAMLTAAPAVYAEDAQTPATQAADGQAQTAMDRSGRVAVIVPCLPPLSFNPLPPLHRGEGYKEGGTVWNHNSL